jgi:AcrR family transcriptional regulator
MTGVRERVRRETTREILDTARRQLATVGPADLSLRAVAREVGLASSAVYRYFASRDELLTALIVAAYDDLGAAVEAAEAAAPRAEHARRWLAVCVAARSWALDHPHEWTLVYGTPVPGYVAPERTIDAATRVQRLLLVLLQDVVAAGAGGPVPPPGLPAAYPGLVELVGPDVPAGRAVLGVVGWTWLVGRICVELNGQLVGVVEPAAADDAYRWEAAAVGAVTVLG